MTKIFISYRRKDDPYAARAINDALCRKFSKRNVYFDLESILRGLDYRIQIEEMVATCDVMLVVIGDDWLQFDDSGHSRLENPDDWVGIEVSSALERDIPVIPVLVGNATIPAKELLPESVRSLFYRQGSAVRATENFTAQIENLVKNIEAVVPEVVAVEEVTSELILVDEQTSDGATAQFSTLTVEDALEMLSLAPRSLLKKLFANGPTLLTFKDKFFLVSTLKGVSPWAYLAYSPTPVLFLVIMAWESAPLWMIALSALFFLTVGVVLIFYTSINIKRERDQIIRPILAQKLPRSSTGSANRMKTEQLWAGVEPILWDLTSMPTSKWLDYIEETVREKQLRSNAETMILILAILERNYNNWRY